MRAAFWIFMCSAAYMLLKRFYLKEICSLIFSTVHYLLVTIYDQTMIFHGALNAVLHFIAFHWTVEDTLASPKLMTHGPLLTQ